MISTDGKEREQLIDEIQQKLAESAPKRLPDSLTRIIAVLGLVIAIVAATANWWEATGTVGLLEAELAKTNSEAERIKKEKWQQLVVFSIIEEGFAAKNYESGVSTENIQAAYLDEARMVKEVELGQDDIQPMALKQILLSLLRDQLVYQTDEGEYGVSGHRTSSGVRQVQRDGTVWLRYSILAFDAKR